MPRARVTSKLDHSDMCAGRPRDEDQGHFKQCPLHNSCHHYLIGLGTGPARHGIDSPYDFEDNTCSQYEPVIK